MVDDNDAANPAGEDSKAPRSESDIPGLDLLANVLHPQRAGSSKPTGATLAPPASFAANLSLRNLGPLGAGGLGVVWSVHDLALNRDVALKQIRAEYSHLPQPRQRFIREARITGLLEHPSIIPIHLLSTGAAPFYTMRLVREGTLHDAVSAMHQLRKDGGDIRSDLRRFITVLVRIGEAIAYAHSKGVVHRDLKPANVVLGPFGEVFVLDWGLAKLMQAAEESLHLHEDQLFDEPDETADGQIIGTVSFMAPEQAAGNASAIGTHTDVFGLGAILFQVLTGQSPHRLAANESLQQLLLRIAKTPAPTPDSLNPRAPRRLVAICNKAMAFRAENRYPAVRDFVDDLNRWLAGESVAALPDRWYDRAVRWALRRPLLVMGVLTALAAVFVLFAARTAFEMQHHRFARQRSADQVRAQLRAAAKQTSSELVTVAQVLEFTRDVWSATLASEEPDDIMKVSLTARKFLKDTLFALADRNAIYIDAGQFDPKGNLIAQVALDESISPFIAATKNGNVVPAYMRDLIAATRAQPKAVHVGAIQVVDEKRRLLLPIATAIMNGSRYRGSLAVHVDLIGCVVDAMISSMRSLPVFLCLYDADGNPLLEVDDQRRVSIAAGSNYAVRFPAFADLAPAQLSTGHPIHFADSHQIVAARRLVLNSDAADSAAPSLLVVMGVSEQAMYEEGDAIARSWLEAGIAATVLSAIVMLAVAYFLVRLRDPGRQFEGM